MNWFISEIQQMMYGFGDSKKPSAETAALVEEIVHQQMVTMMMKASEVAAMRGEKSLSIEDILFLLRKDTVKLKRLIHFYDLKDFKNSLKNSLEEPKSDPALGLDKRQGKSRGVCYEFLASIDQTGELLALFNDKEMDSVKHERLVRAELQTRGMDTKEYNDFCMARQANFSRKYSKSQRFRDWLTHNLSPEINLTPLAVEMFSYLAYECVAQIVDLALLVKQDQRSQPGDPTCRYQPATSMNLTELQPGSSYSKTDPGSDSSQSPPYESIGGSQLSAHLAAAPGAGNPQSSASSTILGRPGLKKKSKKAGPSTGLEVSIDDQILPCDVREAMRRYYTDISPFASCMKTSSHSSHWNKSLCS